MWASPPRRRARGAVPGTPIACCTRGVPRGVFCVLSTGRCGDAGLKSERGCLAARSVRRLEPYPERSCKNVRVVRRLRTLGFLAGTSFESRRLVRVVVGEVV